MKQLCGFLAILAAMSASTVSAQGWGTVTGKIMVNGKAPETTPLVAQGANVKDSNVCAVNPVPDDSLVVSDKGELANCFVYLYQRRGTPDIHPDLKKSAEAQVTLDNKGCRFVPHSFVVRTDQEINVINTDGCGHNVHTFPLKNNAYNLLLSGGDKKGVNLVHEQGELLPMQIKCDIHPWMTAYSLVVEHPYATVSGEDGTFTLEKVPAGEHTFRIWQDRAGYIERSLKVEVKDGQTTDVGTIKVEASKLEG